ncbi:MAG: hypothetical protein CL663_06305 [Bacteroidetes bacterium]|nr:hypothetical protein [Bacteroidota bacterium]
MEMDFKYSFHFSRSCSWVNSFTGPFNNASCSSISSLAASACFSAKPFIEIDPGMRTLGLASVLGFS